MDFGFQQIYSVHVFVCLFVCVERERRGRGGGVEYTYNCADAFGCILLTLKCEILPVNNGVVYGFIGHVRFDVISRWHYQLISTHPAHFVQAWGVKNRPGNAKTRCKQFDLDLKVKESWLYIF